MTYAEIDQKIRNGDQVSEDDKKFVQLIDIKREQLFDQLMASHIERREIIDNLQNFRLLPLECYQRTDLIERDNYLHDVSRKYLELMEDLKHVSRH